MTQNPFQWQHPKAQEYNDTIRRRIIGYEHIFQLMADQLQREAQLAHMLIVGAGGGQEIVTLAQQLEGLTFTAVDPSSNMLELAKSRLAAEGIEANVQYASTTIEELPTTSLFDAASCHLVLHFLTTEQKKSLLTHTAARLKPDAPFFVSSMNTELHSEHFTQMMEAWGIWMRRSGVTDKQWQAFREAFGDSCLPLTTEEMLTLFKEAGFTNVELYYKAYAVEAYRMTKAL